MRTRKAAAPAKTPTILPPKPAAGAGAQGAQGRQGSQGERGATGAGDPGPTGAQGAVGERGFQGSIGAQGELGQTGAQGSQGRAGAPGDVGECGPQGSQGVEGPMGPRGLRGPNGVDGPKGEVGAQGSVGPPGAFMKWPLWMWSTVGVDGTGEAKFIPANGVGAATTQERVSFWGPAAAPGVVTDVAVFVSVAMGQDDVRVTLRRNTEDSVEVSVPAGTTRALVTRDLAFDEGDVFSVKLQAGEEVNLAAGIRVVVYGHP